MNMNVNLNLTRLAGFFLPSSENAKAVMELPYKVKFLLVDLKLTKYLLKWTSRVSSRLCY